MKVISLATLLLVGPLAFAAGCDSEEPVSPAAAEMPQPTAPANPPGDTPVDAANSPRVVFLGDSLTAGLGLDVDEAFPAVLGGLLEAEGLPIRVINGGVSGDTTAGGLRRLDWLLRQKPDVVVVGLGGNDGLRGLDVAASEENLRAIVRKCRAAGASVLLLGMQMPPNYGPEYTAQFRDLYPRLARELDVPLVPFLLEGVGGNPDLNQPDGIHPTAEGQRIVARHVLPHLRDVLRQRAAATAVGETVPGPGQTEN